MHSFAKYGGRFPMMPGTNKCRREAIGRLGGILRSFGLKVARTGATMPNSERCARIELESWGALAVEHQTHAVQHHHALLFGSDAFRI
jgi:hypothetical protein